MTETQKRIEGNTDRWVENGMFPSAVFAGIKQQTKRNGGCTTLFDGTELDSGFVVASGENGFVMTRKEFYSVHAIESTFAAWLDEWKANGFDGFGSWFDEENDRICIDPVTICVGLWTATELAKSRGEKSIYDVLDKRCITVQ